MKNLRISSRFKFQVVFNLRLYIKKMEEKSCQTKIINSDEYFTNLFRSQLCIVRSLSEEYHINRNHHQDERPKPSFVLSSVSLNSKGNFIHLRFHSPHEHFISSNSIRSQSTFYIGPSTLSTPTFLLFIILARCGVAWLFGFIFIWLLISQSFTRDDGLGLLWSIHFHLSPPCRRWHVQTTTKIMKNVDEMRKFSCGERWMKISD